MPESHVEYIGFTTNGPVREYRLLVRQAAGESHEFTLAIPNEAFTSRRVRYQDAPDVCFHKLQCELAATPGSLPAARLSVTDADLEQYRAAHAPKPPQRRAKPPLA